jgi:cytochrome P450
VKTESQFEFASPEMLEDPFPFFEAVRTTDPVYPMPGRDAYLITRREDVEFALQHPDIFSNTGRTAGKTYPGQRYQTCPDLASTDPPEHKARRALYLHLLSPRRIATVRPIMERKAHELIDGFAGDAEVEIIDRYAKPLPAWVMGWLLGVPDEMHTQLDGRVLRAVQLQPPPEGPVRRDRAAAHAELRQLHELLR